MLIKGLNVAEHVSGEKNMLLQVITVLLMCDNWKMTQDELTLSPLGPGGPEIPLSPGIPWRPGGPPSPSAPVGPGLPCVEKPHGQQAGCISCTFHSLIFSFFYFVICVEKFVCITFGPSGPGAPGIPLGPCRPVEPISPLSPGIPRSPWGKNETSCYCELNPHCKLKLLWKSQSSLPLVQFVPPNRVLQEYPERQRWSCIFLLLKVTIRL